MVEGQGWKGFTFTGYQDRYWFAVNQPSSRIRNVIIPFYQSKKAVVVEDKERLLFSRGKKSWTYGGDDTAPLQTIAVSLETINESSSKVVIQYDVRGCFFRLPPYGLKEEVETLEAEILKISP
jgi:hypothetical protein